MKTIIIMLTLLASSCAHTVTYESGNCKARVTGYMFAGQTPGVVEACL